MGALRRQPKALTRLKKWRLLHGGDEQAPDDRCSNDDDVPGVARPKLTPSEPHFSPTTPAGAVEFEIASRLAPEIAALDAPFDVARCRRLVRDQRAKGDSLRAFVSALESAEAAHERERIVVRDQFFLLACETALEAGLWVFARELGEEASSSHSLNPRDRALARVCVARAMVSRGRLQLGKRILETVSTSHGSAGVRALGLEAAAHVAFVEADFTRAAACIEEALALSPEGYELETVRWKAFLALTLIEQQAFDRAESLLEPLVKSVKDLAAPAQFEVFVVSGVLATRREQFVEARPHLKRAHLITRDMDSLLPPCRSLAAALELAVATRDESQQRVLRSSLAMKMELVIPDAVTQVQLDRLSV